MKFLLSALLALSFSLPMTKKAHSSEVTLGVVIGVSLSTAIAVIVMDNISEGTEWIPYNRSDLYQDAMDALALGDTSSISQNLAAFLLDFRTSRSDLDDYSDLEILMGMLEVEHQ